MSRLRGFYDDRIARLFYKPCQITKNDILFGSYQKSGRTWVRFFIAAYVNELYNLNLSIDWNNFTLLTPSAMCNGRDGLLAFPREHAGDSRVIFSHNRDIGRFFPGKKVIYLTRNLSDAIISLYFFRKHRGVPGLWQTSIADFVRNFDFKGAISLINYFSKQLDKASDRLLLSYEELKAKPRERFEEIIRFTNYDYDEKIFRMAMDFSSFDSMRKLEMQKKGFDSMPQEGFHTRRQEAGGHTAYLDDETIEFVRSRFRDGLTGILREHYLALLS
jgi:hypothetical protein